MTAVPFVIHANVDAEARWAGRALPGKIATRASYYAALVALLAPDGPVDVWVPAAIDPARLTADPVWTVPALRVGRPPRADLVWAPVDGKAANDRRLALRVATELGVALPGTHVVTHVDELGHAGPWVAKGLWSTAGRDRCIGAGAPTEEQRTRLTRLLATFGALVVEPWCERVADIGVCGTVALDGSVTVHRPHQLVTDARGTFLGIDVTPPSPEPLLGIAATAAGEAIAALGHRGPYAIDAFVHLVDGVPRLHPLCEINARHTFGTIARSLHARGLTRLGFSAPPPDARVLIAPADDGITAWVA